MEQVTFLDDEYLYRRVLDRHDYIDSQGIPVPSSFRTKANKAGKRCMSTDWSRFSDPADTQRRSGERLPDEYAVFQAQIGHIVQCYVELEFTPIKNDPEDPNEPNNPAHTDIVEKMGFTKDHKLELRNRLIGECRRLGWAISPLGRYLQR